MRIIYLLFVLVVGSLSALAQNTDTVQPDSLYKKLKVHTRTSYSVGAQTMSKEIFVFDKAGRYSDFILTDNETGKSSQLKLAYTYNANGVLASESDTSFGRNGNIIKTAILAYGANGELIRSTLMIKNTRQSETIYSLAPLSETEKLYNGDEAMREQTTYFDEHKKKIRFTGIERADHDAKPQTIQVNGKTFTFKPSKNDENWDYKFENAYDTAGNLITQKRFVDGVMQDETHFVYDKRGLLIEQTERSEKRGNKPTTKFEYSYYN